MLIIAGWRGLGLGTLMLDSAIVWATGSGAHKMALEVWPDNTAALELYRQAGFIEEGRSFGTIGVEMARVDGVVMGRPLPELVERVRDEHEARVHSQCIIHCRM